MVTGHVPFTGETPTETISLILQKEPAPLTRYAGEVPTELERIVSKVLTKDREERYQTAKDLLIDLRRLKHKVEVDAEIDRTVPPEFRGASPRGSGQNTRVSASGALETTSAANRPSASSAEYIVSGIRQHKIAAAMAVILLVIGAIGIGIYMRARSNEAAIESIAVLPFENQNHDPNSDYLSDGVTESIINSLTQIPNMKVIARSSAFRYKGRETDPLAAGKDLGVRAVLTGRMSQLGNRLIVSSELLDVRDGKQLWGDRYERDISDLMAMQRDIAQQITSNLRLKLSGVEQGRVTKQYTDNAEAYQLYLQGRFHWNRRTGEALKKSVEYFDRAIEKDPNYALAYAGLADAYLLFPGYSVASPQESFSKAKTAARKALELDETLAEAHTSLGSVLFSYDWNLPESNREFQRALQLNPNYATARQWYSDGNLLVMGRFDEALAEMRRAQELDPLSLIINAELGTIYLYARQYDKAIQQLQKTIEMDQSFYFAHWMLGVAYVKKGSRLEAIAEFQKARELQDDPALLGLLGHAIAESGNRDEALRTVDQLTEIAKHRYVPAYSFAIIYVGLGDKDRAFQWLDKGYQDHANELSQLKYDPLLDNLRSEPRFTDLMRRVGL